MEKKDFLLREIEKIGMILRYIREKFFPGTRNPAEPVNDQLTEIKALLLTETGLDLDKFQSLNADDFYAYINGFKGYNTENIELLADSITRLCLNNDSPKSEKHLRLALQLYELCNLKSRTYSATREQNIATIKNAL